MLQYVPKKEFNMRLPLKSYLALKNITMKEFAENIGYCTHHVSNICKGKAIPKSNSGRRILKRIVEETHNQVIIPGFTDELQNES